jgi:hypothetical protein
VNTTEYEGRTIAAWFRLELIVVVQGRRRRKGPGRRKGRKGMAVRAGRDGICSNCLAHVVEAMDVGGFEKE